MNRKVNLRKSTRMKTEKEKETGKKKIKMEIKTRSSKTYLIGVAKERIRKKSEAIIKKIRKEKFPELE